MDLDLDIYLTNRGPKNQLYLNDGTGHFTDISDKIPEDGDMTYESVLGDLNGDGWVDVFSVNYGPGSGFNEGVSINDGTGGFVDKSKELFAPNSNIGADDNAAVLVDIDSDSDLDVIVAALSPGTERLYVNNGKGYLTLTPGVIQVQNDATLECAMADVDNNGTYDLVSANGENETMKNKLYINYGPPDTNPPKFLQVQDLEGKGLAESGVVLANVIDDLVQDTPVRLNIVLVVNPETEAQNIPMLWVGGTFYRGVLPTPGVSYQIKATDRQGNESLSLVYTWSENMVGEDIQEPPGDVNIGDEPSEADVAGDDSGATDIAADGGAGDTTHTPEVIDSDLKTEDAGSTDVRTDSGGDTASRTDVAIPPSDAGDDDASVGVDSGMTDSGAPDTGGPGVDTNLGDIGNPGDTTSADTTHGGKKSSKDDGCSAGSQRGRPSATILIFLACLLLIRRREQTGAKQHG